MTELFIEKSKLIHGDRYDYSKVDYKYNYENIIIICKIHGEFSQRPNNHLTGAGCGKCAGTQKSNTTDFVEKSIKIHGNLYDYSKVNYINSITKTTIICQEHGEFQQTPKLHLKGAGCGKCAGTAKITESEFLDKCNEKFGDLYDYSKMNYKNFNSIITICCKIHGDISIIPKSHLKGIGCSKCGNVLNGNKRKTPLDEFIKKCREKHGDKYDYSKVDYVNNNTNIKIICKEHGEFQQVPYYHLNSNGYPKCSGRYRLTTEEFIEKSKLIHGDKYDYSNIDYKNCNTEVSIICKIHGKFSQKPVSHYWGKSGCPKCANKNITTEEFIEKSKLVHGDKYDYSNVIYNLSNDYINIICKIHGEFNQVASIHLRGCGCQKCSGHYTLNTEEFIEKSKLIHGDKYDYSKVEYKNTDTKVIIICKIHGEFSQISGDHINGSGCKNCYYSTISKRFLQSKEDFIEKSKLVHGDKYDYSKVDYKYCDIPVIIVCKIHGEFMKTPIAHYNSCRGCPKCSNNGYSKPSILWLDFLSKLYNINIQHACNYGEYVITTTKYKADGFCKENNTIYEFHGDYWHGNPKVFNLDDFNEITKCTYKDLYDNTLIRENKIKDLGYNLVVIWENDWKKINKSVKILQQRFRKYNY